MTGIEKICEKILAEAQAEADAIIERGRREAEDILRGYSEMASAEAEKITGAGKKTAAEREARLSGAAGLDARKMRLQTKQQLLDAAFAAALDKLRAMPEDEYIAALAALAAKSAVSGREEVILSPEDRESCGKQVVAEANRILNEAKEAEADGAIAKLGHRIISRLTGGLTLSAETRPIAGGVILREGRMEVNATFDTLIRLNRDKLSGEVAELLFG